MKSSRETLVVVLVTLAGAALRLWLMTRNAGLTMDSLLYVQMAEALRAGHKAIGFAHHGYPALVAIASTFVPGRELAARGVSLLAGVAIVPLVYALARTSLSMRWATLAALLAALHPLLAVYSGAIMTEATFLAVATAALLLLERRRLVPGGAVLGLAYTVRPEAIVILPVAAWLARGGMRGALLVLAGFAAIAGLYVGYVSWERGAFTLTPKSELVRAPFESGSEIEVRVGDARSAPAPPFFARLRAAAPEIVRRYPGKLAEHGARVLDAWPLPLVLLSLAGLVRRPGPVAAGLVPLFVLPLLALPADARFAQLVVPSLAVLAARGASWLASLRPGTSRVATVAVSALAIAGVTLLWTGRAGTGAFQFDDGPMHEMRAAGEWLRAHGRPGATIMDRKSFVAFYAGMRHIQLPADDYDTVVAYAQRNADYLVLEEFVVQRMRPQFLPLVSDRTFVERERRLQPVFAARNGPLTGVVVLEVVKDAIPAPVP